MHQLGSFPDRASSCQVQVEHALLNICASQLRMCGSMLHPERTRECDRRQRQLAHLVRAGAQLFGFSLWHW